MSCCLPQCGAFSCDSNGITMATDDVKLVMNNVKVFGVQSLQKLAVALIMTEDYM